MPSVYQFSSSCHAEFPAVSCASDHDDDDADGTGHKESIWLSIPVKRKDAFKGQTVSSKNRMGSKDREAEA